MAVILGEKSYLTVMENLKWAIYVVHRWTQSMDSSDSTFAIFHPPLYTVYQKIFFFRKKIQSLSWKTLNGQFTRFIRSTEVHSPLETLYEFFSVKNTKTVITRWILRIKRNWRDKFNPNLTEIVVLTCSLI